MVQYTVPGPVQYCTGKLGRARTGYRVGGQLCTVQKHRGAVKNREAVLHFQKGHRQPRALSIYIMPAVGQLLETRA
jgi:hypothetical protein